MSDMIFTIIQWTWGFPQTAAGAVLFLHHRNRPGVQHFRWHGSSVTVWKSPASVSLGKFIFLTDDPLYYYPHLRGKISRDEALKQLLVHEYGHTIQSLALGPLYLFAVGLPSMLWSRLPRMQKRRRERKISYYSAPFERGANRLGEIVTGEKSVGEQI